MGSPSLSKKEDMAAVNSIETIKTLDAQALERWIQTREAAGTGVAAICGVAPAQLHEQLPALRQQLRARGRVLLTLDASGILSSMRTLSQVIESYIQEVERLGLMDDAISEMLSWMQLQEQWQGVGQLDATSVSPSPLDAIGRLWQLLSQAAPAILLIFHPEHTTSHLREQIDYLARFYYSDPIAELAPEYSGQTRAQGMLVIVNATRQLPQALSLSTPIITLDVYEHVEQHVRDYVARPEVIARLIESTQGDLSRLDELIEDLGQNIHLLSRHRYLQLEGAEAALVDMLALASSPLEMTLAQRALLAQGFDEPLPVLVRTLMERALITRTIKTGALYLFIKDRQLGHSVVERMLPAQKVRHFDALCEAALQGNVEIGVNARAVRWALEANRLDLARRHGLLASQKLFAQGELQSALELLDALHEHLDAEDDAILLAQIHALQVEIASRLGRYRRALEYSQRLEAQATGTRGKAELVCRQARLWLRVNEYSKAIESLEISAKALRSAQTEDLILARVLILLGEACYDRGDHERSSQLADEVIALLDSLTTQSLVRTHEAVPTLIQARNLSGKVAIFFGNFKQAQLHFEQNLKDAVALGLSDERARARGNLGIVAMCIKDYDLALDCLKEAVAYQAASEIIPRARLLLNLGVIYQHRFEYEQALKSYLESMRVARQNEQARIYAISAYNLATLYRDIGALSRAERVMAHLLEDELTSQEATSKFWEWLLSLKINIAIQRGQFDKVIELSLESNAHDKENKDSRNPATILLIATAHLRLGDWSQARAHAELARSLEGFNSPLSQARDATFSAKLALLEGQLEQALELATLAVERWTSYGHFIEGMGAEQLMVEILIKQGRVPEANARLERLVRELEEHQLRIPKPLKHNTPPLHTFTELANLLRQQKLPIPTHLAPPSPNVIPIDHNDHAWRAWRKRYEGIVGQSPRLYQIFRVLDRVAASATPLLILGESGTGKELIAQATHDLSDRRKSAFIKVNCAAFVESLLMSELFGHEKGAFTGAVAQKIGRFELADGGTLFLDEIADISMQTQVALLRVLQEQEFERVGGTETLSVNVRLICATNKNLEEMVQRGEFRLDLYYRLKGMIIELPALRERREDIPLLIDAFTERFTRAHDQPKRYEPEVLRRLISYSWPGNVRELQNFVRSVLLFVEGSTVRSEHLQEMEDFFLGGSFQESISSMEEILAARQALHTHHLDESDHSAAPTIEATAEQLHGAVSSAASSEDLTDAMIRQILDQQISLHDIKKNLEVESIRRAILETDGNVTQAAKLLQMKRPRLSQIINATPELSELKDRLVQ